VVEAAKAPRGRSSSSRHLTSPLTVARELRRCRLAWRSAPTRSHGGSQGFKSPHLHPPKSPGHRPGGSLPPGRHRSRFPYRAANGQQPRRKRPTATRLALGDAAKRTGTRPPITRRMLGVDPVGSGRIWPTHVGFLVGPDDSRRIVWMIKGHPTQHRMRLLGRSTRGLPATVSSSRLGSRLSERRHADHHAKARPAPPVLMQPMTIRSPLASVAPAAAARGFAPHRSSVRFGATGGAVLGGPGRSVGTVQRPWIS
jgi:hypothetical protein